MVKTIKLSAILVPGSRSFTSRSAAYRKAVIDLVNKNRFTHSKMENKKNILISDIENTFDTLLRELSGFDKDSLNKIPFKGSWTAGQAAGHIIICANGIPDTKTTEAKRPYDEKVGAVKSVFLNFELKFKTDPSIAPGPPPHEREALVQKIEDVKDHLKTIAGTKDLEALCEDMELPTFGHLTRYEWLRFILFHTQRHTHQITEIGNLVK